MLFLGTANWGNGYGLGGACIKRGLAHEMLDILIEKGIRTVDTALVYGEAHAFLENYDRIDHLSVATKIPSTCTENDIIRLEKSNIRFETILLHGIPTEENFDRLVSVFTDRVGVSLNSLNDFEWLKKRLSTIKRVQIPFNIIDQRWMPYFQLFHNKNVEIQTRSAFLQGALLNESFEKIGFPDCITSKLRKWHEDSTLSERVGACLQLSHLMPNVHSQVVGFDSLEQLLKAIDLLESEKDSDVPTFSFSDERYLLPMNWSK